MGNSEVVRQKEDIIKNFEEKYNKELGRSDTKVTNIKEGIYSIEAKEKNRIGFYVNIEGNNIASPVNERKDKDYLKKLESIGYKETNILNEYIMTRIDNNSKIDKYSVEYLNIFLELRYIDSIKYLEEAKTSKNILSRNQALELLPTFISAGSLTIGELESFMERGSITKEDFEKFLPKMRELLKEQTIDERGNIDKFGKEVNEKEIKDYFQKGYIDINLAKELYEIIKKRKNKEEEKKAIKKNTQSNLIQEKSEYNV